MDLNLHLFVEILPASHSFFVKLPLLFITSFLTSSLWSAYLTEQPYFTQAHALQNVKLLTNVDSNPNFIISLMESVSQPRWLLMTTSLINRG